MSLAHCLDKYPRLPPHVERSVLLDVASGLHYLHHQSPAVMHRDLTANNILLTSHMQAKISDLGQAKLLERTSTSRQTTVPGNLCYMPPEAMVSRPRYSTKIDIFSFGVLILHVVTHQWPFRKKSLDQKTKKMVSLSEVEQRKVYLDKFDKESPLRHLAEACLSNDPSKRPDAMGLVEKLTACGPPPPFPNTLELELAVESESAKVRMLEARIHEINLNVRSVVGEISYNTSEYRGADESTLAEAYIQLQEIAAVNHTVLSDVGAPDLVVGYKSPKNTPKSDLQVSLLPGSPSGSMNITVRAPLSIHFTGTLVGTIEGIKDPWGLVAGSGGRVFVTDGRGYNGVRLYDRTGELCEEYITSLYSYERALQGKCYYPRGIDLDGEDALVLADTWCHRVQRFKFSSDLKEVEFEKSMGSRGDGEGQFNFPQTLRVDKETGDVYVCDKDNHRIQVLSRDLQLKFSFGERGDEAPSQFHYPQDVDFDSQGNIYIADCGHYVIKVFNRQLELQREIGEEGHGRGSFHYISSICIDKRDYLYVADKTWNCVQVFDPMGEFVMQVQLPRLNEKSTSEPRGIAVDEEGFVYVSCNATGCVHIYK